MALERMIIQAMALWKVMFLSRRRLMLRGGHCIDEGGGGEGVRGEVKRKDQEGHHINTHRRCSL